MARSARKSTTGVRVAGALVVYQFPALSTPQPVEPSRLVQVPNDKRLDPGNRDFVITLSVRTTQKDGNIVQKGQATSAGGYFKVETHGSTTCTFQGSAGRIAVGSGKSLADGAWHTIRCERNGTSVSMIVDGKFTDIRSGATGTISNSLPLTIGGKRDCNQVKVGCDYFTGDIDRVQIDAH